VNDFSADDESEFNPARQCRQPTGARHDFERISVSLYHSDLNPIR
jgi:hypothetical protein